MLHLGLEEEIKLMALQRHAHVFLHFHTGADRFLHTGVKKLQEAWRPALLAWYSAKSRV